MKNKMTCLQAGTSDAFEECKSLIYKGIKK